MYSSEGDLLGKRIRIGGGPWLTIVGIVPNVKNRKLDEDAWPYIYRPYSQWVRRETMLVVRTSVDPLTIVGNVRQEVAKLDPELPLANVSTIQAAMDRSLVTKRLTNWLLAGFAATALFLALTGIYGVMSLNVANRTERIWDSSRSGCAEGKRSENDSGPGVATGSCWRWVRTAWRDRFYTIVEGFVVWNQCERSVDVCSDRSVARRCRIARLLGSCAPRDESRSARGAQVRIEVFGFCSGGAPCPTGSTCRS